MTRIASILLHLDASDHCPMRLDVAARLARRLDATVTALYAAAPPAPQGLRVLAEGQSVLMASSQAQETRARARALFDSADTGPQLHWAELDTAGVVPAFARQALLHDLVVVGQHDPEEHLPSVPADFVETLAVDSGRPVLAIPHAGRFADLGQRVLVAWKPTREAARAVTAMLPLLIPGAQVHVCSWGSDPRELQPLLLRHGIEAEFHQEGPANGTLGEQLLSRAADIGADLMVMGCYGHSRARELLLGGASRTVLSSMTLPVLLAH